MNVHGTVCKLSCAKGVYTNVWNGHSENLSRGRYNKQNQLEQVNGMEKVYLADGVEQTSDNIPSIERKKFYVHERIKKSKFQ